MPRKMELIIKAAAGRIKCFNTLKEYSIEFWGGGESTMPPNGSTLNTAAKMRMKKIP